MAEERVGELRNAHNEHVSLGDYGVAKERSFKRIKTIN